MRWVKHNDQFDISSAGLMRRRHHSPGNPKGRLLSPKCRANGSVIYMYKENGKSQTLTLWKGVRKHFSKKVNFSAKWVEKVREYVAEYNSSKFGQSNKQKAGKEVRWTTPAMWDVKKFGDPWDNYTPYNLVAGEYGLADICPLG